MAIIETPLTRAAIEQLIRKLDALEVEAVAISLLNSYVNASHEIAIAEAIAKTRPSLKVSCSGTLSPEIREYERTSTTILNALLIPIVSKYLDNLAARMRAEGFSSAPAACAVEWRRLQRRHGGPGAGAPPTIRSVGWKRSLCVARSGARRSKHRWRRHGWD